MRIEYAHAAVKVINGMDRPTKQRIKAGIEKLPQGDIKPYKGSPGTYRLRVGDWRILFSYPPDRKTLFGNVVKKCIQCSRTSEKRNNIVKKFKYSASYFELYTKFTPNEKDFRCGFQISYEP